MSSVQFNSSFYKKINMIVTKTARKGLADLSKKSAHWGIKGHGDLPKIMGILEFGDPAHTFPNTKKGSSTRKKIENILATPGGTNGSAIPPRPWLQKSIKGSYRSHLTKYINDNLPVVLRGLSKQGVKSKSLLTPERFIKGLAEVGAQNARDSWESANFTKNAPATLANKNDSRPLHGDGKGQNAMSSGAITAWSD